MKPVIRKLRVMATAGLGVLLLAAAAIAGDATWNQTALGTYNWGDTANWTPNTTYPNGQGQTAYLNNNINDVQTIDLNQDITVGAIYIGNANAVNSKFNVGPGSVTPGSLTFDVASGNALLYQYNTSQINTISAPIYLADDIDIQNWGTKALTITGKIDDLGGNKAVHYTGLATNTNFTVKNNNTYTGGTTLDYGFIISTINNNPFGTGPITMGQNCQLWDVGMLQGNVTTAGYSGVSGGRGALRNVVGINGNLTFLSDLILGCRANNSQTMTINGRISGTGWIQFGLNTSLSGGTTKLNNTDANNLNWWDGDTKVYYGLGETSTYPNAQHTLQLEAAEQLPHGAGTGNLDLTWGGRVDLNGYNETVNALIADSAVTGQKVQYATVKNTATGTTSVLYVGGNDADGSYEGILAADAGTLSIDKIGAGTQVLLGANTHTGASAVTAGTLKLGPLAHNAVLTLGGADIKGGKMVFDYAGGSTPAATVVSLLAASYNGGAWDTGQFQSSTADANHGLGWADDGTNSLLAVQYALYGDADLNGAVDVNDLNALINNYGTASGAIWAGADFNYDGAVDVNDLNAIVNNYGGSLTQLHGMLLAAGINSTVPEPSSLLLLAAGLAGLLAYAWKKRR